MKIKLLLISVALSAISYGQTVLFHDDFENGNSNWTLNSSDMSATYNRHKWVVNNQFTAGVATVPCALGSATADVTFSNVASQPSSPSFAGGNYLHIISSIGEAAGLLQAHYTVGRSNCGHSAESYFTKMSNSISTVGYTNVQISFAHVISGSSANYGSVFYSLDNGNSWIQIGGNISSATNWQDYVMTNPAWDNVPNLRFAFRFTSNLGNFLNFPGGPSFSIDNFRIIGQDASETYPTITTNALTEHNFCSGVNNSISVPFTVTGTVESDNVYEAFISNASGSFTSQTFIGALTSSASGNLVINGQIPSTLPAGTGYRIRVRSTNTWVSGSDNGMDIVLNASTPLTISTTATTVCPGGSVVLTAAGTDVVNFVWSPNNTLSATTGTSVTATPTASTTYSVTTTDNGCFSPGTITITMNDVPTISLSASSSAVCEGGTTTITASGASTYTWMPSSSLNATSGATVNATLYATETFTVTGTSTQGCTNTSSITIEVSSNLNLSVTSPTTSLCEGASTTLSASGADSYIWSPAAGLSATTGASVTATPTETTTYTVTGLVGTCEATGTITLTVTDSPTLVVTAVSPTVCEGTSTILSTSGADSYNWSPAAGLSATTGASVTATPTETTTYTVTGLVGTCEATGTITITVTDNPTIAVNAVSSTLCEGASTTLSASGADSYTWSPAAGLSATSGASITATPTETTTYTVTGLIGTCEGSGTITITVSDNPTIAVNAVSSTLCEGTSTTLDASGADSYIWSPAAGLSATSGASITATPTETTTYTVTGLIGTCEGSGTITITVSDNPTIAVNAVSSTLCEGTSTTLDASGADSYIWSPAAGLSATTGSSVTATPTETTTYTVTGLIGTCEGSETITITVNDNPVVTATASSTLICEGNSTTLTATGADSYTWSPANSLSATTGASVTASPTETTTFTVEGVSGDCSAITTITITVDPCLSISKVFEQSFVIYPNPTASHLTIQLSASMEVSSIQILDMTGRILMDLGNQVDTISVEDLVPGNYFVCVNHSKGISIEKFIKQ